MDPEDPRPPYQQVAAQLRAAILTRKLTPGERLPSQAELSQRYGVARVTAQQALRILKDEGLTVSRQGAGVFVRERSIRPAELRPHIDAAFSVPHVTLDFAGFTSETLHNVMQEPLDRIRDGRVSPLSIEVRLLLAHPHALSMPAPVDATDKGVATISRRTKRLTERHALAVRDSVTELQDLGLVASAIVKIRTIEAAPLFKAYIINGAEVFFGYYPVTIHDATIEGKPLAAYDLMGKDAVLMHYAAENDPDSAAAVFIQQTRLWFDSVWTTVATEYQP
ncbi:putative GntR family transcriptional regulator [Austwickia chelonae NBRC 105200]|uniref:Putative GntR family transcriptional regulator n=2 Tax=Austwickia TaxID=1184606 RepID=K6W5C4_9MICO|nr:putative GntR family transcriptional regulator [Austwickia chelonae NBRC 105200]